MTADIILKGLSGYWSCFTSENSPLPPSSFAYDFAAGTQGKVWMSVYTTHPPDPIAKPYALYLTDGTSWSQHKLGEQGLASGPIDHLVVDSRDRLWFSVYGVGIYCFDGRSATVYEYGQCGLPQDDWVAGLYVDASDRVWCAMLLHGIYWLSQDGWQISLDCQAEGFRAHPFVFGTDRDSHLWAVCSDSEGTDFLSLRSGKWKRVCSLPRDSRYLDAANCLIIDRDERVWFGTDGSGLLVCEEGHWRRLSGQDCPLFDMTISSMAIDAFGNLWVGTGGLAVFDGERWHTWEAVLPESSQQPVSRQYLSCLEVEAGQRYVYVWGPMAIDSLGRKWIGASNGAILCSRRQTR